MSTPNMGFQAGQPGMTQVAILDSPGNLAIMAHSAKFALRDFIHGDIIGARPHFKPQFVVTDLATKTDSMKPVRKHHGPDALLFRIIVQYHVAILRTGRGRKYHSSQQHPP